LQSAFWKRFGKEPSFAFPMDLTNLQALLNDQKAGSGREWTSHQLAFRLPSAVTATLRTDWGLHDIGKINVPETILLKPGPLDAEERRIMQEHPIIGEKICAPLKSLRRILPVIRHHHEKMDGSGYPDGLRGEAIPLKARILQIADIYDALTTNRPYRGALPPEEALQVLFSEAQNGWLDASVVLKFSQICRDDEYFPVRGRTMLASYYA
jgi:HD-GYP domain-containing protein (c-di-GMP phosphodiesterase class II)